MQQIEQLQEFYKHNAVWNAIMTVLLGLTWAVLVIRFLAKKVKEFEAVKEDWVKLCATVKVAWIWAMKKAMWRKHLTELVVKQGILLEKISKEVQPNGGTSLKDAVRRLEQGQEEIKADLNEKGQIRNAMQKFSDTMTFHMSHEGCCTFINDAFLKFFGCTEADVLEFAFENMVHEDDLMELRTKWTRAIDHKTAYRDEQRIRHKLSGKFYNAVIKADPIVVDGELKSFYGTIEIIND